MTPTTETVAWTCIRCEVTTSFIAATVILLLVMVAPQAYAGYATETAREAADEIFVEPSPVAVLPSAEPEPDPSNLTTAPPSPSLSPSPSPSASPASRARR